MKIFNIALTRLFCNNIKHNKNICTIQDLSLQSTDIEKKQFDLNYPAPLLKAYTNETELNKKPEYYYVTKDKYNQKVQTPVSGEIIQEDDGKIKVAYGDRTIDFSGNSYERTDDEIKREIRYFKGYPVAIIDYKDNEEYKFTRYSQHSHKVTQVYYFDGSFELSQKTAAQNISSTVELQFINEDNEKIAIGISAPNKVGAKGNAQCSIPTDDGYKTLRLEWTYPDMNYSYCTDDINIEHLKNALYKLEGVINDDEFKNDFASCNYLNEQLSKAIKYLNAQPFENL